MDVTPATSAQTDEVAVERYEAMVRLATIDEQLARLGEAGSIGFFPRAAGREAALVGTVAALSSDDWLFPSATDWPLPLVRGQAIESFAHRAFGTVKDVLRGRDVPSAISARALRIASSSAPAATQLPHAVGLAWSARQRGEALVSVALLDATEVDAPDFHTGLNFAGVMNAPTLFVCRVRPDEAGAAEHAIAYGIDAARADGSDVDAVTSVIAESVERARAGQGPTVIDLELGEAGAALERAHAALGAERASAVRARTESELTTALEAASRSAAPDLRSLFDDVYGTHEDHLAAQLDEARGH